MNLMQNKKVLISLLKQGDVIHTLHGGHVETDVNIRLNRNEFIIEISAPTVGSDAFNIMLDHHKLIIGVHARHPFVEESAQFPMFARRFHLPGYIDYDQIVAKYQPGRLEVVLPFRKLNEAQRRRISINHL